MFSFLPEQTFFIFRPAIKLTNLLQFLAFFGQTATQCIQEMHLSLSVSFGLFKGIAPVGHSFAHRSQEVHFPFATGLRGTPPYSRYGLFPGNLGVLCISTLSMIFVANSSNSFPSARSGRRLMNMTKVMTAVVKTTSRTAMYMPEMSRYVSHSQMELFYILQIITKEKQ